MMKLSLERKFFGPSYTIGKLSIDGIYFCDTLEDVTRDINRDGEFKKVYAETAIPYGTYTVIVTMSSKMKRYLPRLLNVPNFEGILIHRGNTSKDTAGCILVGENKIKEQVINSTKYEIALIKKCLEAISKGERIKIEIY